MDFNNWLSYRLVPLLTGDSKKNKIFITHMSFLNWRWQKKSMQKALRYLNGVCLDIGSGNSPHKYLITKKVDRYVAIDKKECAYASF